MNNQISVRTPGSHKNHGRIESCGCATPENTGDETDVVRCPCGALYLKDVVITVLDFICYDCKRPVHQWSEHRGRPVY